MISAKGERTGRSSKGFGVAGEPLGPPGLARKVVSIVLICAFLDFIPYALSVASETEAGNGDGIIRVRGDLLTVKVRNTPLDRVLKEIADQASIKIVFHGETAETVSAQFSDLPMEKGLKRLIRDVNVALIYDRKRTQEEEHKINQIIVYAKSGRRPPRVIEGSGKPPKPVKKAVAPKVSPESILDGLKDADPAVREEAVARLETLKGDQQFIRQLTIFFLSEEDPEVRARVDEGLEDFLVPEVRLGIVEVLEKIGGEKAVTSLKEALEDDDETVRGAAAAALEKVRGQPVAVHGESSPKE